MHPLSSSSQSTQYQMHRQGFSTKSLHPLTSLAKFILLSSIIPLAAAQEPATQDPSITLIGKKGVIHDLSWKDFIGLLTLFYVGIRIDRYMKEHEYPLLETSHYDHHDHSLNS